MRIGHNLEAISCTNSMKANSSKQAKVLEKLSSGLSINRAGDNAAGLSISEKMRSQIRGLDMASKNTQDAISLIQTADGALSEVHNIVQRMRELSVQAASDTYTEIDRESIQVELNQMAKEVTAISEKTSFNNINLLDGSQASNEVPLKTFVENGGIGLIFREEVSDFATTQTGMGNATAAGHETLKDKLSKEIVPQAIKGITSSYANTFGSLNSSSIGIGLKLYSDNSSTLAYVSAGWSSYGNGQVVDNMMTYTLGVNVGSLNFDANGNLTAESRKDLETTIVHEMVHALMDETLTNGMMGVNNGKLDKGNKFPDWFAEGMAQTASGGYSNGNDWVNIGLGIDTNTSESQISSILKNNAYSLSGGSTASEYGTGYLACMYLGHMASGATQFTADTLAQGVDKVLLELKNGKSLNDVIKEVSKGAYTSVSDFQNKFGDAASSKFVFDLTKAVGDDGNGGLVSKNLKASDLLPDQQYTTNLFKLDVNNETIKNIYPQGVSVFTGGGKNNGNGAQAAGGNGVNHATGIKIQVGANEGQSMTINIDAASADSLGIGDLSVRTHNKAADSIDSCDQAIRRISYMRSNLGSYQNRLEYTMSNLDNTSENMQAAESRIRDTNMAKSMTEFTKLNILVQAAQSMLAQSNQKPQEVLKLLQ